jgi:hypothetical protein
MAQTAYPNRYPRGDLRADKEKRHDFRNHFSPAFGFRRRMDFDHENDIIDTTFRLQGTMQLPGAEKLVLRDKLAVTLLSQRVVANQLQRGRVTYDVGRLMTSLTNNPYLVQKTESVWALRGEIRCMGGRVLYAMMEGAAIEEEIFGIDQSLSDAGLRPAAKETSGSPSNPHMTIAQTPQGVRLSKGEEANAIATLEQWLPDHYLYQPWEPRPEGTVELDDEGVIKLAS